MTAIAILLALVALAGTIRLQRRVAELERALDERSALVVARPTAEEAIATPAPRALAEAEPEPEPEPLAAPAPAPFLAEPASPRISLESLIGGRLPIWIGGAALVLAGFFLVRYSIESGLIGPAARTIRRARRAIHPTAARISMLPCRGLLVASGVSRSVLPLAPKPLNRSLRQAALAARHPHGGE